MGLQDGLLDKTTEVEENLENAMYKKIIFFIATLDSGGAERVLSVLSEKMLNYFEHVEIVSFYDIPDFYLLNDKISRISLELMTGTKSTLKNCIAFRNYLEMAKPTVLVSFLAPFNIIALLSVPHKRNYPVIVADRNDPRFECRNLVRKVLRHFLYKYESDRVVVQTKNNKRFYPKLVQNKMDVIYNPISISDDIIGCSLNIQKEKVFVNVARLEEQKNQRLLFRSFSRVIKKYPNYRLVIYGEGPLRSELEAYAKELAIDGYVSMPGRETAIIDKIKSSKAFVLSSNYEGMSNSMLEALCIGLPVISTEVSGAIDLIKNEENGILVPIKDELELTNAMLDIIENSAKCEYISNNAVKVAELLNVDIITKEWIKCINEALCLKRK